MKKIFSYSLIMMLGLLGLASCTSEYEYDAPAPYNAEGTKVSFEVPTKVVIGLNDDEFQLTAKRSTTEGELTVPVIVNKAPDCFSFPQSVTFADGADEATISVKVSEGMEPVKYYDINITTANEYLDPYKEDQDCFINLSTSIIKEDYAVVAEGIFHDPFWYEEEWEQVLEYSPLLDLYRLPDLFEMGFPMFFKWDGKDSSKVTLCDENGKEVKTYPTGMIHPSYGMVSWTLAAKCEYDGEGDAFYFPVSFTVAAGSFGADYEVFNVTKWY